ncbi:MAG: PepSY-like domain-containing protein [Chitinophagales bacterium]|nr:PepSY-like domain-containing protein [Chitinophagales bacterium]
MKKLILMTVAAMITSLTFAQKTQDKNVPAIIKSAFKKQYPETKEVKWEKENENYEAEFEVGETDYSVLIDASGNIIETEIEISSDALPANAKEYVSQNHAGQKIKEAAKITDAKGTVTYEAEIKGTDLIFDSNGNFIKEVKE